MSQLIRLVNHCIKDLFILNGEDLGNDCDQLKDDSPNTICDGELHSFPLYFLKDASNGFITGKPFCKGKYVILQRRYGCSGNLSSKILRLTFSQSQQAFGLFEQNFQRPTHGINLIGCKEIQRLIGCYQSIPGSLFVSLYKEEPEICISEDHICRYVIAAEPAAIPSLLSTFKQFDKCRSCHLLIFKAVFGSTFLPDFYHTQVMTSDMSGADKTNDLRAGEPTVGQYIIKTDTFSDGTGYHGYHQLDLTLFIFGCTGFHRRFLIPFLQAVGKFANYLFNKV